MSDIQVTAVTIDAILHHPNAERLDLATIGGYTTVVGRDEFKVGDIVAYFPPDILIPEGIATQLGVAKYLKSEIYPGDIIKTHCRVAAARLRGVPSFGFVQRLKDVEIGADLTERFHAVKYEPIEPLWWNKTGDQAKNDLRFHYYTNIENYRNPRFKGAFTPGLPVRITEKIHGTNSRVALIGNEYMCGSHKTSKKEFSNKGGCTNVIGPTVSVQGSRSLYWNPLTEEMKELLQYFVETKGPNVIAFGEIFGSKVQFLDYGVQGQTGYRLFDISVNGEYVNWGEVEAACLRFHISTVPLLYTGPFYLNLIDQLVDGPTTVSEEVKSSFKGREGIVITPLFEGYSDIMGGRLIAKAVSCDYLSVRKSDCH